MPKRAVRIVKHIGPIPCVAVCTFCSLQFKISASAIRGVKDAIDNLQAQFDAHTCTLPDSGQNILKSTKD
jgi:hypothetical protein